MVNTLLGTKAGMTSSYDSRGRRVGATMVKIEPNLVTQVKSKDGKDRYDAIQLGYGSKKSVKKPQIGHAKKAGFDTKIRWFRESRIKSQESSETQNLEPGTEIKLDQVFSIGDAVKVTGISKGRGFAGVVKRHGFHGGPKTHGQSDRHRAPGSIGAGTTPGRVYKGKKMAGHMGAGKVSYKGLEVLGIDKENNLLTLKGGVPGPVGGLVIVEKQGRIKGYTPPPAPIESEPEEKPSEEEEVKGESVKGEDKENINNENKEVIDDSVDVPESVQKQENAS